MFPALYALVFLMHLRNWGRFAQIRWRYTPAPPDRVVAAFIDAGNRSPLIHDPHVVAYLALPLMILSGWSLHVLARAHRPAISAASFFMTLTGTIYLGGLFGMWTAFYRGLGNVDPKYLAGAVATFAGMTAPSGAFLLTTTLAKLGFVGLTSQALALIRLREVPAWSIAAVCAGCVIVLVFWDLDNLMLIGVLVLGAGLWPVARRLRALAWKGEPLGTRA